MRTIYFIDMRAIPPINKNVARIKSSQHMNTVHVSIFDYPCKGIKLLIIKIQFIAGIYFFIHSKFFITKPQINYHHILHVPSSGLNGFKAILL